MKTIIRPRVAPRDISDALLSTAVGSVQLGVLFAAPALIVYLWTESSALAAGFAIGLYLIFAMFTVSKLEVDHSRVKLKRIFGVPKMVRWSEISEIREATRSELIRQGWLWPLFPAREMTPSYTSVGHYRFQYGENFFFFPPSDVEEFLNALPPHLTTKKTTL
jgi:hypothetical protein